MNKHWSWTPVELSVLCNSIGRDIPPAPLRSIGFGTPGNTTYTEWADAVRRAATTITERWDSALYDALGVLSDSQVRIQFTGFFGSDRGKQFRCHAALRNQVAVLLDQDGSTGQVSMSVVEDTELSRRLIAFVPEHGAGKYGKIHGYHADLNHQSSYFEDRSLSKRGPGEKFVRFTERTQHGHSCFRIFPGPSSDDIPTEGGREIHYVDYDDGRYHLWTDDDTIEFTPIDPQRQSGYLARTIREVREEFLALQYEPGGQW